MSSSISVVIPLYNHEAYIEAALESVFRQSLAPAEIIVVDDGSTDASASRVRALLATHPEIIFWSQPNQGAHHALNAGIHRATGQYVSILNSDDAYRQNRFEECLKILESRPDVSALATGVVFIDENGFEIPNQWYTDARAFYERVQDLSLALIHGNFFVTTSNLIVRKSVLEEIGYFAPLRYTHDLDFFLRLLASNKRIYFLDAPLLQYRMHRRNTIQEDRTKVHIERAAVTASYVHRAWCNRVRDAEDWPRYFRTLIDIAEQQGFAASLFHFFQELAGAEGLTNSSPGAEQLLRAHLHQLQPKGGTAADESTRMGHNAPLREQTALRDALIADQKSRIAQLEEGNRWLAGQNEQLEKELQAIKASRLWRILQSARRRIAGQR
jgi:glycosyltransferase involved in cell wall biosynthesis